MNVPRSIGLVVSRRLATLNELDCHLGTEDLHDLIEIIAVDTHNANLLSRQKE